jgi:glycosyltransferase involved in cell wall biosynthesis
MLMIVSRPRSDDEKLVLLRRCCALVYTPANEHFGICPLEAMYMQKPVIAVRQIRRRRRAVAPRFIKHFF